MLKSLRSLSAFAPNDFDGDDHFDASVLPVAACVFVALREAKNKSSR
jgi:hypothetical protein